MRDRGPHIALEQTMCLETWLRIGTYTYYSNSERKSTARKRGGHTYPCEFTHSQQQTFINAISIYFVSLVAHNANKGYIGKMRTVGLE